MLEYLDISNNVLKFVSLNKLKRDRQNIYVTWTRRQMFMNS